MKQLNIYSFEKGITQGRQGDMYDGVHEPKPEDGKNLNQMSICGIAIILAGISSVAAFPAAGEVIHVNVNKMVFSPEKIKAHVGDVVEWNNSDVVAHSATEKDGWWEVMLPVKGNGKTALTKEGTVEYYCKFHPNMIGKIEVVK
jgi:plastocyanin